MKRDAPNSVWVKICGTTNLEDALAAVEAGADALGFVFADSPRRVDPSSVAKIVHHLPDQIEKVGVFVNESAERIREVVAQAALTGVQLHGDETLEFADRLSKGEFADSGVRVIPAFSIRRVREVSHDGGVFVGIPRGIERILIDSATRDRRGGTGRTWDWGLSRGLIAACAAANVNVIVAGGLRPTNVGAAIETMHPWGVDVASGVERELGKKDHEKVRAFVKAAKNL